MKTSCTLQIHIDGAWRDAGALSLIDLLPQGYGRGELLRQLEAL